MAPSLTSASKVTLTLWVHENSGNNSTSTSGNAQAGLDNRYGQLPSAISVNELQINPEILVNNKESPLYDAQVGEVFELVGSGPRSGGSMNSTGGAKEREERQQRLVFKIDKGNLAGEGSSSLLQISVSQSVAQACGFSHRDQVVIHKLPSPLPSEYIADHVEVYFKDQYLGRADMHRLSLAIADKCVYAGQRLQLAGLNVRARIGGVWVAGKQRKSALINSETRTVFRSESAKYYIFIQLSKEMWLFDDDGSLFYEKALDLFLPELFSRWSKRGTNHIVSIVLFSRILYRKDELSVVQRPLMLYNSQRNPEDQEQGKWTDVYKVIVEMETNADWQEVLRKLRQEFQNFREEILLKSMPRPDGKLAGVMSWAHEGGVLEAMNMALNGFSTHYVDRDLNRTGLSIVIITAGTAHFTVDKDLLRLTTERMIDEGFGVDLVSLAKMPLHAVPLFRYSGIATSADSTNKKESVSQIDALYLEDADNSALSRATKKTHYTIPHWIDSSFYARHQDKPFRCDRFLPRCRMPIIQTVGLAEYENASISLPPVQEELKLLAGSGPDWDELSEREKRRKMWDRFDEIACGGLGKYEVVDMEEKMKKWHRKSSLAPSKHSASSFEEDADRTVENTPSTSFGTKSKLTSRKGSVPPPIPVPGTTGAADPDTATVVSSAASRRGPPASSVRMRSGSSATSSTLSKRPSHVSLRSPSTATVTSSRDVSPVKAHSILSRAMDRQAVSSASSSTVVESPRQTATPASTGNTASSALASLMAAQAKLTGGTPGKAAAAPNESKQGGWFWNRKSKAAVATTKQTADSKGNKSANAAAKAEPSEGGAGRRSSSPTPSAFSRKSSMLSMKPPVAALSVTPATPATATTTTTASSAQHSTATQPMTIAPTPAAFKVATNDTSTDPRSLEEGSLQQYFLDASKQSSFSKRIMAEKVEQVRKERLRHLNPSNPSRSSPMLWSQSRRWINIFPRAGRINNQRSVKWKSLCTPACLPLYTDYMPDLNDPKEGFKRDSYSIKVDKNMKSFLLKPGDTVDELAGNLLREMVCQRLAQSFQIIMPAYDNVGRTANGHYRTERTEDGEEIVLPVGGDIGEILYNTPHGEGKAIYLGFSNTVHKVWFDHLDCAIRVIIWTDSPSWSRKDIPYSFMLWPHDSHMYTSASVDFAYPEMQSYDWKAMDKLIAGHENALEDKIRYWRTRFVLVPLDVDDTGSQFQPAQEGKQQSTTEEARIAAVINLHEQFSKASWFKGTKTGKKHSVTFLDPSVYAADEHHRRAPPTQTQSMPDDYDDCKFLDDYDLAELATYMREAARPLPFRKLRKGFKIIPDTFTGQDIVSWLEREFVDVPSREVGLKKANALLDQGMIVTHQPPKRIVDAYQHSYSLATPYGGQSQAANATGAGTISGVATTGLQYTEADNRAVIPMTGSAIINLDPHRKSDRAETAYLHFDLTHNPENGYHFQLNWLGTSRLVEDLLGAWQRQVEKNGLRLVEETVQQVKDVSKLNPLQAAEHIKLSLPPPTIPNLAEILGPAVAWQNYYEMQLLRRLGYILDFEADSNFPNELHADYSYKGSTVIEHTQFIHRSGTCYIQILGGEDGFLFLKNRLFLSHRQQGRQAQHNHTNGNNGDGPSGGVLSSSRRQRQADPAELKRQLKQICASPETLEGYWAEITEAMQPPAPVASADLVEEPLSYQAQSPLVEARSPAPLVSPSVASSAGRNARRGSNGSMSGGKVRRQDSSSSAASYSHRQSLAFGSTPLSAPLPESLRTGNLPYSLDSDLPEDV